MQQNLFPDTEGNALHKLKEAEEKAALLFAETERRGLIVPGKTEKILNREIYGLARDLLGVKKHWHKRIVRAGRNTLFPYRENPPDLELKADDILFFDFGPVLGEWEADFGRTYVLGNDPDKLRIKNDVEKIWYRCKNWFDSREKVTGAELYTKAVEEAGSSGWEFGAAIAGHLVGKFPHEKLDPKLRDNYICAANHFPMDLPDKSGNKRYWILEIHLVDRQKEIGAFFEQLLTV